MEDPIAVWRAEFCELQKTKMDVSFFDGRFLDDRVEILFLGFCIAKRSNTVVTINSFDYHHCAYVRNLCEQLTKAGIAYRVEI